MDKAEYQKGYDQANSDLIDKIKELEAELSRLRDVLKGYKMPQRIIDLERVLEKIISICYDDKPHKSIKDIAKYALAEGGKR